MLTCDLHTSIRDPQKSCIVCYLKQYKSMNQQKLETCIKSKYAGQDLFIVHISTKYMYMLWFRDRSVITLFLTHTCIDMFFPIPSSSIKHHSDLLRTPFCILLVQLFYLRAYA